MISVIKHYGNTKRYKKILKNMHKCYDGTYEYDTQKVLCFTHTEDYAEIILDFEHIPPNSILICEQVAYLNDEELSCFYGLVEYIMTTRLDVELYYIIN